MASTVSPAAPVALLLSILQRGICEPPSRRPTLYESRQGSPQMPRWRQQIVRWAMQVAREFRLGSETVALAVNFFDRLLSAVVVPAEELQTASLACLLIASKLLDRAPLSLRHVERYFSAIASRDDVCMAELNILYYLHWDANAFTALDFMRTALQLVPDADLKSRILSRAELAHEAAMLEYRMLRFHPCTVGFACIDVACEANGFDVTPLRVGLAARGIVVEVDVEAGQLLRCLMRGDSPPPPSSPSPMSPVSTQASEAVPASPSGSVGSAASINSTWSAAPVAETPTAAAARGETAAAVAACGTTPAWPASSGARSATTPARSRSSTGASIRARGASSATPSGAMSVDWPSELVADDDLDAGASGDGQAAPPPSQRRRRACGDGEPHAAEAVDAFETSSAALLRDVADAAAVGAAAAAAVAMPVAMPPLPGGSLDEFSVDFGSTRPDSSASAPLASPDCWVDLPGVTPAPVPDA